MLSDRFSAPTFHVTHRFWQVGKGGTLNPAHHTRECDVVPRLGFQRLWGSQLERGLSYFPRFLPFQFFLNFQTTLCFHFCYIACFDRRESVDSIDGVKDVLFITRCLQQRCVSAQREPSRGTAQGYVKKLQLTSSISDKPFAAIDFNSPDICINCPTP